MRRDTTKLVLICENPLNEQMSPTGGDGHYQ